MNLRNNLLATTIFSLCVSVLLLANCFRIQGATALSTGDVAILGLIGDSSGDEEFSWVPLVGLETGTQIYFTDIGFFTDPIPDDFASSPSSTSEFLLLYTASGAVSAGAVQTVSGAVGGDYSFVRAEGWGQTSAASTVNIQGGGDQIYAFQSSTSPTSATFGTATDTNSTGLFAATSATTDWTSSIITSSSVQSNLYPDLTDGTNAIANGASAAADGEFDNIRYEGITTGTAAELLAAISNVASWGETQDQVGPGYTNNGVTNFTVTPVPEPGVIAFAAGFGICVTFLRRRRSKV